MVQSAKTIADGVKDISNGNKKNKLVYDAETGDFTMVPESAPVQEGHVVDDFAKDGFAAK